MLEDNKQLFRDILDAFLLKHSFELPALLNETPPTAVPSTNTATPA